MFWLLETEIELLYTCQLDLGSLTILPLPPSLNSDYCQTESYLSGLHERCEKGFLMREGAGPILPVAAIILQQLVIVNCSPYLQPERRSLFSACGLAVNRVRLNSFFPL